MPKSGKGGTLELPADARRQPRRTLHRPGTLCPVGDNNEVFARAQ